MLSSFPPVEWTQPLITPTGFFFCFPFLSDCLLSMTVFIRAPHWGWEAVRGWVWTYLIYPFWKNDWNLKAMSAVKSINYLLFFLCTQMNMNAHTPSYSQHQRFIDSSGNSIELRRPLDLSLDSSSGSFTLGPNGEVLRKKSATLLEIERNRSLFIEQQGQHWHMSITWLPNNVLISDQSILTWFLCFFFNQ